MRVLELLGAAAAWVVIGAVLLIALVLVLVCAPVMIAWCVVSWMFGMCGIMARWRSRAEPTRIELEIGPELDAPEGKAVRMANVSLGVGNRRVVTARFKRRGAELPIDGNPRFVVDNEAIAKFEQFFNGDGTDNPSKRWLVGVGAGQTSARVVADARQGDGVREIESALAITVPDPEATEVELEIGEEEENPTT